MSDSAIRDNRLRGSVGEFLQEKIQPGSSLSFVSAFFTVYAHAALSDCLDDVEKLRFLFGEPRFVRSIDPDRTESRVFRIEEDDLVLANKLQQRYVAQACADWITERVDIRSVRRTNFLHGKMYHIEGGGQEDAIVGSSNFTVRGLGLRDKANNIELNLVAEDRRDIRDIKAWFDEIWDDLDLVEDVTDEVLKYLAQLYANQAPEFVYYKTLFHIFSAYLSGSGDAGLLAEDSQLVDTPIWNALYDFQKDGVKGAIAKILTHNGCIIADSVGLGKTFEALAIIRYFELRNHKVLVLCPNRLRENWTVYQAQNNSELNPFVDDRFAFTVLSHTDLSRDGGRSGDVDLATLNWGNYDLVVIDESHNFRNNTRGRRDEDDQVIRKSRYERLMEDIIRAGVKTKVLLLSATPVNTDLRDLRNQIYLLTEGRDDAFSESLGIGSLRDTLGAAQRAFNEWARRKGPRDTRDLLERLGSTFFTILDELTIARSRRHIEEYYPDTLEEIGGFPERLKPVAVYPEIDTDGMFMSYDLLNDRISEYRLALFSPSEYVREEYRDRYSDPRPQQVLAFSQGKREHYLIGMMKVNFLKRLESSVHSFAVTMERTVAKIDDLEQRIRLYQAQPAQTQAFDLDDLAIAGSDDDEMHAAFQIGRKLQYDLAHLDLDRWLAHLQKDRQQLHLLHITAKDVTPERDAKLAKLKSLIAAKARTPTVNSRGESNRKVLVFTAFADTAVYLYDELITWARQEFGIHVGLVTGGSGGNQATFGKTTHHHVITNFSPRSKQRDKYSNLPQEGEIDLLIATDCISEGQNLQDCDYVVNYDIHWNPVRIIQRFGRVDRIGSLNAAVQLVNFWPTDDLNRYLNLTNRVEARMALVDVSATSDDNLLDMDNPEQVIDDDLRYRDQQLLRLRDEVLDLEDLNESVTLSEFTLDDFRIELTNYIENNRQRLEDAPKGLSAVVPTHPDYAQIAPGTIFCLEQKGDVTDTEFVNPLRPYYLVYVRDDGEVRFTFAQPKQILEIMRVLCSGEATPYGGLCELFDGETDNGSDMSKYTHLLTRAVASIARTFRRRAATHLLSGRGATLMGQGSHASEDSDFELVTWLVVRDQ